MNLWYLLLASLAVNALFFVFAAFLRTDVFTDITYSLSFVLLSVSLYLTVRPESLVSHLTLVMVVLWAIRLGSYLFFRIMRIKVDHRFDDKRNSVVAFGSFWLLQAVSAWIIMLPVTGITLADGRFSAVPPAAFIPFAVLFIGGLSLETVADAQKYAFKKRPENANRFMSSGVWRYSRHPNYLGEIIVWWSLALPGAYVFEGFEWFYFLGPLHITLLLLFVSGIPLLEKSADLKWGKDESYAAYKARTPPLVPNPFGKRGAS